MIVSEKFKTKDLNEQADKVERCEEAAILVKEYEDIIGAKKKNIFIAYQQGKVFRRFKDF